MRPCGVAIRALKPDTFKTEYRLLFESVRFAIFELNEGVKAELTNEEVLKTRLLSEDPISILRMYFEKGMSKANFTIISEYSKILELLLETNVFFARKVK